MAPRTSYARNGGFSIAYQVVGDGPVDIVHAPPGVSHLEYGWEGPEHARYLRRLASFSDSFSSTSAAAGFPTTPLGSPRWKSAWTTCAR